MKWRILAIFLTALMPIIALGRLVQFYDTRTLVAKSELVFVGEVKSVRHSGITTSLSYPTWDGVDFEWLIANVEVLEPVKGGYKGNFVQAALLSVRESDKSHFMVDQPGMLDPKTNDLYLFFLDPTPVTNVFAAVTAPFDDDEAIFRLDRSFWEDRGYQEGRKLDPLHEERRALIWSLVDETGNSLPLGAQQMRKTYAKEIKMAPSNDIIYLQWEAQTNSHAWIANFPKGYGSTTNSKSK